MKKKQRLLYLCVFNLMCLLFITACSVNSDTFGNVSKGFKLDINTNFLAGRFLSLLPESQRKNFEQKTLSYLKNANIERGDYGKLMGRLSSFDRPVKHVPFDKEGKQVSIFKGVVALPKCKFYEVQLNSDNLLPTKEEDIIVKEIKPKTIGKEAISFEKGKEPPEVFYWFDAYDQNKPFYLENKAVWYILMDKFYLAVPYAGKVENEDIPVRVFLMEPQVFSTYMKTFESLDENSSKFKENSSLLSNSKLVRQLAEDYACLILSASIYASPLESKYKEFIINPNKFLGKADNVNVKENKANLQVKQPSSTNSVTSNIGIINGNEVNVRKGPGKEFKSLGVFFKGDKVRLVGEEGNSIGENWYQIEYDNPSAGLIKGWVRKDFININQVANNTSGNTSNQSTNNNDQSKDVFIEHWNSENLDIYVVDESLKGEITKTGKQFTVMVKQVQNGKLIKTHKWSFTEDNGEWRYSTEEMDKKGRSSIVSESKIFEYCMKRLGWKYVKNGRYYQ